MFSPHAWGWSDLRSEIDADQGVLPTRVGMVRFTVTANFAAGGSPHTRGDGPHIKSAKGCDGLFSPHAWGWSVLKNVTISSRKVLPTRVGMVRPQCWLVRLLGSSPHTRGDGPRLGGVRRRPTSFSPHAWGWSASQIVNASAKAVLPTRVGMVRCSSCATHQQLGSPHTRGDGPETPVYSMAPKGFSPRSSQLTD